MKEHFTLRYSSTDNETNDTIMDLEMNFDNPSDTSFIAKLNTWLIAIGKTKLQVVTANYSQDRNESGGDSGSGSGIKNK
jgi:hypothetical protein